MFSPELSVTVTSCIYKGIDNRRKCNTVNAHSFQYGELGLHLFICLLVCQKDLSLKQLISSRLNMELRAELKIGDRDIFASYRINLWSNDQSSWL
jgi:hypothetical protein